MNLTTPVLSSVIRAAERPGDTATTLVQKVAGNAALFGDDDGGLGMVMSAVAGVAAALAVAIMLSVYFRTGYRSPRDVVKHGLAATIVLALIVFAYDMRQAASGYLGINPAKPATEFEIRLPRPAVSPVNASSNVSNSATIFDSPPSSPRMRRYGDRVSGCCCHHSDALHC
ncbi:MAG TPA: hypothetical protein VGC36_07760 [Rhizomicrobium sp.]